MCGSELGERAIRGNYDCFCSEACYDIYSTYQERISTAQELIPPFYRNFDISKMNQPEHVLEKVLNWDYKSPGLILYGESGCGKTFYASQLMLKLILIDGFFGKSVGVYMAGQFERELLSCFGSRARLNIDDFIGRASRVPILLIDDLGKEGNGDRNSGRFETSFFQIVENRIANMKPTIITTNYVGKTLENRFNDMDTWNAIYRRFKDYYDTISFYRRNTNG